MEHHTNKGNTKFQLERIALFSDAIFAIAITLLIIEIKVPEVHTEKVTDLELWNEFAKLIPKFIGFILSFIVIGLYWLAHHRIFKYVTGVSQKLLWTNLLFMLPIVIMPFSTAFLSDYYYSSVKLPLFFYTLNICLTGYFNFRLWKTIQNPKNKLSEGIDNVIVNYNITRALVVPILFVLTFCMSFFINWAFFLPFAMLLVPRAIKAYYKKKYPEIMENNA